MTMTTMMIIVSLLVSYAAAAYYSYDGSGNNEAAPLLGSTLEQQTLTRLESAAYYTGVNRDQPVGGPSAALLSDRFGDVARAGIQATMNPDARQLSQLTTSLGQFICHDMAHTPSGGVESFPIPLPGPNGASTAATVPFTRAVYRNDSVPRDQLNLQTAWLDLSVVYGFNAQRALALRALEAGKLRSDDDLDLFPPYLLDDSQWSAETPAPAMDNPMNVSVADFRVVGDTRGNENPVLLALHTLFLRAHNNKARQLALLNPTWTDEHLYQEARAATIATYQRIVYEEYLPAIVGSAVAAEIRTEGALPYDPTVNGQVENVFSTTAFRFGHTAIQGTVMRRDENNQPCNGGDMPLRSTFFQPTLINGSEGGIEIFLRGAALNVAKAPNPFMTAAFRVNFLAQRHGDLFAIDVQRGRDNGNRRYADVREDYGLARPTSWADITPLPWFQEQLASTYATVDEVDLFVGGVLEPHLFGASVGPLFAAIIKEQFVRSSRGDRFHYLHGQQDGSATSVNSADAQSATTTTTTTPTMAQLIRANAPTALQGTCIPENVFVVPQQTQPCLMATGTSAAKEHSQTTLWITLSSVIGLCFCIAWNNVLWRKTKPIKF